MWEQRVSEGWTNVLPLDGTDSRKSSLPEPSLLEEEVPENLGHEWRVLHPFELPRVKFPTDTTPPNQRRLAENDALVELIQTMEHLEDIPMWGQRDYWFYPPRYGDPFYRRRGRGRGRRELMGERPPERDPTQGFGRGSSPGFGRGNGRGFYSQGPLERNERYRQEEERSSPASDGREGRDIPISSPTAPSHQRTPPTPAPSEDRLFTDWSSVRSGSLLVRTPPQSVLIGESGHKTNQITPQPSHPITEQTHMGVAEDALQENLPTTTPTAQQQPLDRSSVMGERRVNDIQTNTSDMVVESTRDRTGTSNIEANAQTSIPIVDVLLPSGHGDHVMIPHVNLSISGYEPDSLRTSGMRSQSMQAQEVSAIPQVDGPGSLPMRDPIERWMNGIPRLVE